MKIAIGNDHAAVEMKQEVVDHLVEQGHEVINFGTDSHESCDYPVYGKLVAHAVADGEADLGILICGTGIGISLAANKVHGVRAACCSETYSARLTRMHNDANILAFGARVVGPGTALDLVDTFINTPFEGGRHARRVAMIEDPEND